MLALKKRRVCASADYFLGVTNDQLDLVLRAICLTKAAFSRRIASCLQAGKIRQAYYFLTIEYPLLAVESKKSLFLSSNLFCVRRAVGQMCPVTYIHDGEEKEDTKSPILSRRLYGANETFTPRTVKVRAEMEGFVPYFDVDGFLSRSVDREAEAQEVPSVWEEELGDEKEGGKEDPVLAHIQPFLTEACLHDMRTGQNPQEPKWYYMARSGEPTKVGTYIHEVFGEQLVREAAKFFLSDKDPNFRKVSAKIASAHFDVRKAACFVPGRLISGALPLLGVTPDGICVEDRDRFTDALDYTDPQTERIHSKARPFFTLEIKTVNPPKEALARSQNQDEPPSKLREKFTCTDLDMAAINTPQEFLDTFVEKIGPRWRKGADTTPVGQTACDKQKGKTVSGTRPNCKPPPHLRQQKKTPTAMMTPFSDNGHVAAPRWSKGVDVLDLRVDRGNTVVVSAEVLPVVAPHHHTTLFPSELPPQLEKRHLTEKSNYLSDAALSSKRAKKKEDGAVPRKLPTSSPRSDCVHIPSFVQPGRAIGLVYRGDNQQVPDAAFIFDEAPLTLNMRSEYFAQVCMQKVVTGYYNPDVRTVFAGVVRDTPTGYCRSGGGGEDEGGEGYDNTLSPARIRLVYMYEVGLTRYAAHALTKMVLGELNAAASYINASRSALYSATLPGRHSEKVDCAFHKEEKEPDDDHQPPVLEGTPDILPEEVVRRLSRDHNVDPSCFELGIADHRIHFVDHLRVDRLEAAQTGEIDALVQEIDWEQF